MELCTADSTAHWCFWTRHHTIIYDEKKILILCAVKVSQQLLAILIAGRPLETLYVSTSLSLFLFKIYFSIWHIMASSKQQNLYCQDA